MGLGLGRGVRLVKGVRVPRHGDGGCGVLGVVDERLVESRVERQV